MAETAGPGGPGAITAVSAQSQPGGRTLRSGRLLDHVPLMRTYESTLRMLSVRHPRAVARADFANPANLFPWGGPMNGQRGRQEIVRRLHEYFRFVAVVETGTYRGTTTEFLSYVTGAPVHTVESEPRYFHYARERLRKLPDVHVRLGDSRTFLKALAASSGLPTGPTFFYLDAHWYDDLPLVGELRIIADAWPDAVVMIDDFQVPDDPGYGFDIVSRGVRIAPEIIPDDLSGERWHLAYPAIAADDESGARRGCAVLLPKRVSPSILDLFDLRPGS